MREELEKRGEELEKCVTDLRNRLQTQQEGDCRPAAPDAATMEAIEMLKESERMREELEKRVTEATEKIKEAIEKLKESERKREELEKQRRELEKRVTDLRTRVQTQQEGDSRTAEPD